MSDNHIYNEDAYKKFSEELPRALEGPNIKKVDLDWLEPRAKATGVKTKFGSYGWRSVMSSRIAPKTVYLGGKNVRLSWPSEQQKTLIAKMICWKTHIFRVEWDNCNSIAFSQIHKLLNS